MGKLKQLNKDLQRIQEKLESKGTYSLSEELQNIIDEINNLVEARVSPIFGEKVAEIRNLFSPILNYFTIKDEKQELMKTYFGNKKKINALDKIELLESKNLRTNKPYNKIKTLLDELG